MSENKGAPRQDVHPGGAGAPLANQQGGESKRKRRGRRLASLLVDSLITAVVTK